MKTTTQKCRCGINMPATLAVSCILSLVAQHAKAEWILSDINGIENCASACAARGTGLCDDTINTNVLSQITSFQDLIYVFTEELGIGINEVVLDSTVQFVNDLNRTTIPPVLGPSADINIALYPERPFTDTGTMTFACDFSPSDYGLDPEAQRLCCCGSDATECPTIASSLFTPVRKMSGKKSGGKRRNLMMLTEPKGEGRGGILSSLRQNGKNTKPSENVMKEDSTTDEKGGKSGQPREHQLWNNSARRSLKKQQGVLHNVLQESNKKTNKWVNRRVAALAKYDQEHNITPKKQEELEDN